MSKSKRTRRGWDEIEREVNSYLFECFFPTRSNRPEDSESIVQKNGAQDHGSRHSKLDAPIAKLKQAIHARVLERSKIDSVAVRLAKNAIQFSFDRRSDRSIKQSSFAKRIGERARRKLINHANEQIRRFIDFAYRQ